MDQPAADEATGSGVAEPHTDAMTGTFLRGLGERAAKTFAQTLIAVLTLSSPTLDVLHVNLLPALSIALGATLLSVLTSVAGLVPPVPPGAGRHDAGNM